MKRNTITSINIFSFFLIIFATITLATSIVQAEESNRHDFNIFVEAPASGDEWEIGKEQTIEWSDDNHHDAGDHRVILWLSTEIGGDSVPVDTFPLSNYVPGEGGSVTWTATGDASEACRITLRHLSDDPDVSGIGGMESGEYFSLLPATAIQVMDHTPQFSLLLQPAKALHLKLYDVSGRLVWESNKGSAFKDLQKELKNGTYLVMYDYASQRYTQKINLVR